MLTQLNPQAARTLAREQSADLRRSACRIALIRRATKRPQR
ncbi:hypothetical protein ABH931_005845 [Streptacidiphilus sp. MAP12-33]